MPKKRGKKRKKGKKGKKDAKKLLQEQLLKEKATLEAAKAELVTELSQLMTNYWQEEGQLTDLKGTSNQAQKDIEQSREFLQRNITQYDQDVQNIGAEVKRTAKEIKNLEKYVVMETARIEEQNEKIKEELLVSKEMLLSKFSYTNIFKIMHRELMEACLRNEESRSEIEQQCSTSVRSYENQSIVQISQLKEVADKQLETFLSIASDCFEKMISRKTQEVIGDNLKLSRRADREFKNWMNRKKSECLEGAKCEAEYDQLERLDKNICKLERILADLINVRNAERPRLISQVNFLNSPIPLKRAVWSASEAVDHTASEEADHTGDDNLDIDSRTKQMLERHDVLRALLDRLNLYVKDLKGYDYNFEQYEEIANQIIDLIKEGNS